jgi:ACS family glucarate transporter-like MFS transporter
VSKNTISANPSEVVVIPLAERPTRFRYLVVGVTSLAAVLLYLDRVCIAILGVYIRESLRLSDWQWGWVLGAFFYAYALCQVPAGRLGDRIGPRRMLTLSILAWSACTAATGLAGNFIWLMLSRLACGVFQAGAYPTAAVLNLRWFPLTERGKANSAVSFGGRIGGALAPWLTALLVVLLLRSNLSGPMKLVGAHGQSWRLVLMLYGGIGILVAILFWSIVRDDPHRHPWCNASEAALVPRWRTPDQSGKQEAGAGILRLLVLSRNMGLCSLVQFCINIGWIFLITLLPGYLKDVHGVAIEEQGRMMAVPIIAGCFGMIGGGFLTDRLVLSLGLGWGRALPIGVPLFVAAAAFLGCPWLSSAWSVVAVLSLMAVMVDLSVPSIWAFVQDVGRRDAGQALGWGNMWGNLGAAVSPVLLTGIKEAGGWNAAFMVCAAAFLIAGVAGLGLNAEKPLRSKPTTIDPGLLSDEVG